MVEGCRVNLYLRSRLNIIFSWQPRKELAYANIYSKKKTTTTTKYILSFFSTITKKSQSINVTNEENLKTKTEKK